MVWRCSRVEVSGGAVFWPGEEGSGVHPAGSGCPNSSRTCGPAEEETLLPRYPSASNPAAEISFLHGQGKGHGPPAVPRLDWALVPAAVHLQA